MTGASNDDFRDSFFEECEELIEAMHDGFDRLAANMDDAETMNAIFRAVHSIKGGAGAFGLSDLVAFAHHFETALDRVRSGALTVDEPLLELFRHLRRRRRPHLTPGQRQQRDPSQTPQIPPAHH